MNSSSPKVHTIFPDSQKDTYGNGVENIDFTVVIPDGKAYVPNSLKMTGKVRFYKTGTTAFSTNDYIVYDHVVGMHGLFRSVYQSDDGGTRTSVNEYPGWVKQWRLRTISEQDLTGSSYRDGELCAAVESQTAQVVSIDGPVEFCVAPLVSLNMCDSSSGGMTNRNGNVRLTFTTNNTLSLLKGQAGTGGVQPLTTSSSYFITDLKLHYQTREATSSDMRTRMKQVWHAKHTVNSSNDTFNANLPIVADSFCAYYVPTNWVNSASSNEYSFINPGVERLELTYNNSSNEIISFPLKSQEEILLNSLHALDLTNKSPATLGQVQIGNGDKYTIGLNFGEPLDLKRARLSVRTQSSQISSNNKHFLNLYAVGDIVI